MKVNTQAILSNGVIIDTVNPKDIRLGVVYNDQIGLLTVTNYDDLTQITPEFENEYFLLRSDLNNSILLTSEIGGEIKADSGFSRELFFGSELL